MKRIAGGEGLCVMRHEKERHEQGAERKGQSGQSSDNFLEDPREYVQKDGISQRKRLRERREKDDVQVSRVRSGKR